MIKLFNRYVLIHVAVVVGWVFLFYNILTVPFKFNFRWILFFILVFIVVNAVWTGGAWVYLKFADKNWEWLSKTLTITKKHGYKPILPWFLFTLGEDGLCFVPLLYVGDNYFTVGISTLMFGVLHSVSFTIWGILPKTIAFFIVAFFILPKSGIAPLVVGHWLLDIFFIYVFPRMGKDSPIPFKHYYENGTLQEEGQHIRSKREGLIKWYYPNGKISSEIYYSKDHPDGSAKWFYENGELKKEGTYKDGKIHGLYKWFKEDGSLSSEAYYENGNIIENPK